jgi:integrase
MAKTVKLHETQIKAAKYSVPLVVPVDKDANEQEAKAAAKSARSKRRPEPERGNKLYDGQGLIVEIKPTGSKLWRFRFKSPVDGKIREASFGAYPSVTLEQARIKRAQWLSQIGQGIDPMQARENAAKVKAAQQANTFKAVAERWYDLNQVGWADKTKQRTRGHLINYVYPVLEMKPVSDITIQKVLEVIRFTESKTRGDTATKVLELIRKVLQKACIEGAIEHNPARDLTSELRPFEENNYASIIDPVGFGKLLAAIEAYDTGRNTKQIATALRILPYLFTRPGDLRAMKWDDLKLDQAQWNLRMAKTSKDLIVPLCPQVVTLIRQLQPLTGRHDYVFANSATGKPISENSLNKALTKLGCCTKTQHTAHGFRASATTMLDEQLRQPKHLIDHQGGHPPKDTNGTAYNRTAYIEDRTDMMMLWANYIDDLKAGGDGSQYKPVRNKPKLELVAA